MYSLGDMHEREARCRRCGRCCARKIVVGNAVFYTPYYCPHLDPETKLCTVYERRRELNPHCLTVEEGIELGVFPADCPYVAGIPGYRPPVEEWDEQALDKTLQRVADGEED